MIYPMPISNSFSRQFGAANSREPKAQQMFDRAAASGKMKKFLHASRTLKSLKTEAAGRNFTQRYLGTQTVALADIQGSMDKADDFDRDFHPLNETTENRWVWVATAMLRGDSLPPVELIRMGNTYYVVDGHHRISVAKMLKHHYIDAVVTVWD